MKQLSVRNRQRQFRIDARATRKATSLLLEDLIETDHVDLAIVFMGANAMAKLNEQHLQHSGPTDIITFDYGSPKALHGELIICPAIASENANTYCASLGREIARYIIHGILHLSGYDDKTPTQRRSMKREENRLLRQLARRFPVDTLAHG